MEGATTIYRCNKIIIKNPRKIDDEMALNFYKVSNIPEKSYYKIHGILLDIRELMIHHAKSNQKIAELEKAILI